MSWNVLVEREDADGDNVFYRGKLIWWDRQRFDGTESRYNTRKEKWKREAIKKSCKNSDPSKIITGYSFAVS